MNLSYDTETAFGTLLFLGSMLLVVKYLQYKDNKNKNRYIPYKEEKRNERSKTSV